MPVQAITLTYHRKFFGAFSSHLFGAGRFRPKKMVTSGSTYLRIFKYDSCRSIDRQWHSKPEGVGNADLHSMNVFLNICVINDVLVQNRFLPVELSSAHPDYLLGARTKCDSYMPCLKLQNGRFNTQNRWYMAHATISVLHISLCKFSEHNQLLCWTLTIHYFVLIMSCVSERLLSFEQICSPL